MPLVRDWARVFPPRALGLSLPMLGECCPLWVTGGSSCVGHPRVHQSSVRKAKCQCIPPVPPPSSEESLRGCCCLLKNFQDTTHVPLYVLRGVRSLKVRGSALKDRGFRPAFPVMHTANLFTFLPESQLIRNSAWSTVSCCWVWNPFLNAAS